MENVYEMIKEFISQILTRYPNLHIAYSYDDELDEYDIWHNSPELEFNDEDFSKYVGQQADGLLFKNGIYNFSFGYNHYKSKELEFKDKLYDIPNMLKVPYKFIQINAEQQSIYKENLNINTSYGINIEFRKNDTCKSSTAEGEYRINHISSKKFTFYEKTGIGVAS